GYDDTGYELPPLTITDHVVEGGDPGGVLFPELGLKGITGRQKARRASIEDRCKKVVELVKSAVSDQWILWCGLNAESDALGELAGAVNVQGSDSYEKKRAAVLGFVSGKHNILVSKSKIVGFGLNFQHCHHMAFVGIGDSYEQYYQMIRRCWRFGQQHPVDAHIVVSNSERAIVSNVRRKQADADEMARQLLVHMREFEREELAS